MNPPTVYDLYCGLGGWAEGFLSEGYRVIGFDIERRPYPGQFVLQDVRTLHGSQFRDAAIIVASPPCQEYSYMAMPWKRSKAKSAAIRADKTGTMLAKLNALFDACFRIQREASEAAGHYIPLVVENVKGAQPWVGRAKAHFGSFYLWGDIESVGGRIVASGPVRFGIPYVAATKARKNDGGSWFAIGSPGQRVTGQNPDGRNIPGMNFHEHEKTGKPGRSFQSAAVEQAGVKVSGDWFGSYAEQKAAGTISPGRLHGKNSSARKAASALIAKIPFPLAQHIARVYKPESEREEKGEGKEIACVPLR